MAGCSPVVRCNSPGTKDQCLDPWLAANNTPENGTVRETRRAGDTNRGSSALQIDQGRDELENSHKLLEVSATGKFLASSSFPRPVMVLMSFEREMTRNVNGRNGSPRSR